MAKLSIKIESKDYAVTIKGDPKDVKETFREVSESHFNSSDLNQVQTNNVPAELSADRIQALHPHSSDNLNDHIDSHSDTNISTSTSTDIESMSLFDVAVKNLPNSETEWITTFAFYMQNEGMDSFKRGDIIKAYNLSKRKTSSRINNLSTNIKSACRKSWIRYLNESDLVITEEGKKKVLEILNRPPQSESSSTPSSKKAQSKKSIGSDTKKGKNNRDLSIYKDLDLRPSGKESLKDFAGKYVAKTGPKRVVLVAYYLINTLGMESIDQKHIRTGMYELTGKVPSSIYQIIHNVKTRNKWLMYDNINTIKLSKQGEHFVDYDLDRVSNE